MKIKHPALLNTLGLLGSFAARAWTATIDWKAVYIDPAVDTVHPQFIGRCIYVGWHEYMLMPIVLRGNRRMAGLTSEHSDAELASRVMGHLGWGLVRGSSTRGGSSALLRMLRDDDRCPSITPDGPRGPRRTLSSGVIFLASKLGLPIVSAGYAFDRPWRLRSWDRFAVPRPFSRARAVFGPGLRVPARLDRTALEAYRVWFEWLTNWLTGEAETWAESGRSRPGEMPMLPGETPSAMYRRDRTPAYALPDELLSGWAALGNSPPIAHAA